MLEAHSHTITNPIITVTEHSPLPSPDLLKRQVSSYLNSTIQILEHIHKQLDDTPPQASIDSQLDDLSQQGRFSLNAQDRKPSLTRSQTDSNITYACEDLPEAPGAACYITKEGDIDIQVVLKVSFPNLVRV